MRRMARARMPNGTELVYDRTYPPATVDLPIVRAIAATNPDLVVVCSYPPIGRHRARGQ